MTIINLFGVGNQDIYLYIHTAQMKVVNQESESAEVLKLVFIASSSKEG
jgi:hypothetical protein